MSKDQKFAAVKKSVHAMKKLDTDLNGEFIIVYYYSSRKLLFLFFFFLPYVILLLFLKVLITVSVLQF